MKYLLGLDVSTTATKALLIDERGEVGGVASHEYTFDTPQPGWTEQPAEYFWDGTVNSVRAVLEHTHVDARDIAAIGLTGQMHGMTLLDAAGAPVRPVILWNDQRTAKQCAHITRIVGDERVIELTGNPVLTGFTAPKIVWTREHEPETFARAAKVLLPKDYARYRLSNTFASDVSDASGTSLLDVRARNWSDEMLRALEIPRAWLPDVVEGPDICARVSKEAAAITGLMEGTPIVGGGGDQAAGAVGSGTVREGIVSASLGTSGVVFAASREYRPEPRGHLHTFCHAVPGMWHWMGVMLSAAGSLRWWRDAIDDLRFSIDDLSGATSFDQLTSVAAKVAAGCEGLVFLPYLNGERTPHPDPNARGVFFGLGLQHTLAHLTRAVLEGVSFGLRDSLELMRGLGLRPNEVRASGGGAKSALWRQILADVFEADITTVTSSEGAAYGAALLAGVGAGVWQDVPSACDATVHITSRTSASDAKSAYARTYSTYRALYPALAPLFGSR